jgi:hypothetical protein
MKTKIKLIAALLVLTAEWVQATNLHLGSGNTLIGGPCWFEPGIGPSLSSTFTLPGVSGSGTFNSSVLYVIPSGGSGASRLYSYSIDLSAMSAPAGHCLKASINFGTPASCDFDGNGIADQVLVLTNTSGLPVYSATLNVSSILFQFGSGAPCLPPGQTSKTFAMLSYYGETTNYVTITDDYFSATTGLTNHYVVNVLAITPPFTWIVYPLPPWFQGILSGLNGSPQSGPFDIVARLYDSISNGVPLSDSITGTVSIANGLINLPLNFDLTGFIGTQPWLDLAVRPTGRGSFTPLSPRLAITPTPQAIFAYTAGSVSAGHAVTSLDGLTDDVSLQAGSGIVLGTNGNALTISAVISSDRNLKTGFTPVNPRVILDQLATLPLQNWRYLNEASPVHHLGPMAQDFKAMFGLGSDDKTIGLVDADGVALAAIQGLNQKLTEELKRRDAENAEWKQRLEKLEQLINEKNEGAK